MTASRSAKSHASSPSALVIPEGSPPPRIHVYEYDENGFEESDVDDIEQLLVHARTAKTTWVDIQGLGDAQVLLRIAEIFGIHRIALADAVNFPQRAKADAYSDHILVIGRAPAPGDNSRLDRVPQVSLLIGARYLVSFQERYFGYFDGVRERIRTDSGSVRTGGPSYLAAAMLGALVDQYYPVVAEIAQRLDEVEEGILGNPSREAVSQLHQLQRRITTLRRVARPQAEALGQLCRDSTPLIGEPGHIYLRDVYDRGQQIMGRLDGARETASDTMAAVHATLGHRQNEVMKVLTLVGSVFIPLTFIAGIYGMNFEYMPELKIRGGYPTALGTMAVVAVSMIVYFRHRGWIGNRRR